MSGKSVPADNFACAGLLETFGRTFMGLELRHNFDVVFVRLIGLENRPESTLIPALLRNYFREYSTWSVKRSHNLSMLAKAISIC